MSGASVLRIGDVAVYEVKRDFDPFVMMIFTEDDKRIREERRNRAPADVGDEDSDPADEFRVVLQYAVPVEVAVDRLEFMGFSLGTAEADFERGRLEEIEGWEARAGDPGWKGSDELRAWAAESAAVLRAMSFQSWCDDLATIVREGLWTLRPWEVRDREDGLTPSLRFMLSSGYAGFAFPCGDMRSCVRAAIEVIGAHGDVVYDFAGLVDQEYVDPEDDLCAVARRETADDAVLNHKIIILTEGKTDQQAIEGAFKVIYPHLAGYYSFLDFEGVRAPGGAGVLAKTVKAFAGAGVVNRVIAIFDNDTAGQVAIRSLAGVPLPPTFRILRYPDLALLRSYPTLGPSGVVEMDVNGLAASLELYFGRDVLKSADGTLTPVQWRGYEDSLSQYQGEVNRKVEIQRRFFEKLRACREAPPDGVTDFDWSGMKAVLDLIRSAFRP